MRTTIPCLVAAALAFGRPAAGGLVLHWKFDDGPGATAAADASNPRVFLLRGVYQLYVPEEFGGGPDSSLEYLDKAMALFEKESVTDPLTPSWGKDEAFTNAALASKRKGESAKAVELLKRALEINPKSGRARGELADIQK